MTINGITGSKQVICEDTTDVKKNESTAKSVQLNSVFEKKTNLAQKAELPEKLPVPQKEEEPQKMSRKEAKEWIKQYKEEHGCSKKEAKAAFHQEFGYKIPKSEFMKRLLWVPLNVFAPKLLDYELKKPS